MTARFIAYRCAKCAPAGISSLSATLTGHFSRSLSARGAAGRSACLSAGQTTTRLRARLVQPRHCEVFVVPFLKKKNSGFLWGEGTCFWLSVAAGRTSEGRPVLSPPCYLKIRGGTRACYPLNSPRSLRSQNQLPNLLHYQITAKRYLITLKIL